MTERKRQGRLQKLTSQAEAFLIATACSGPPEGRNCWMMQMMLAQQLVTLEKVESISNETVHTTLKTPN